jgi:hypothetical protein
VTHIEVRPNGRFQARAGQLYLGTFRSEAEAIAAGAGYHRAPSAWDGDEGGKRIDTLREMWLAGSSAGVIAQKLGPDVTRNMVIGKIKTLGMFRNPNNPKRGRGARQGSSPSIRRAHPGGGGRPRAVRAAPAPMPPPVTPLMVPLLLLGFGCCKYPVGAETGRNQLFCALATDRVYCEYHDRVAHNPTPLARLGWRS